ncbi:MAG: DUF5017 domain-containing protein, partial [Muribaculaceae bacterium]|nr:DUF5017 domain-containing protein [Muribaculaceae bacterium]
SMTSADYKAVAENEINIELAGADTLLLKAVGKNGYFTSEIPAIEYLPAFLASTSSPYCFAPVGSKVNITYQEADSVNPVIAEMARAAHYKVSAADYQSAWKSNEDFIEAFAPMTSASAKLPAILKEGIKDATAGQYAIVNYEEAETNPVFISGAAMTEIYAESFETGIGLFSIDNVNLPDSLKYVWYHDAKNKYMKASAFKAPNNYESESWLISPDITLGGTKANFSFSEATNYFSNIETAKKEASVWVRVVGASWEQITDYDFPTSMSWTWVDSGEIDLSMYCGKTIQIGFKFTSTAAKSGTWEVKNFVVNAEEGSVAAADSKSMKKVLASTPAITSKVAVYKYDGNAWEAASDIMVIQPAQYTAMGYNNNALGDLPITLPLYMKVNAPYAVAGDSKTVVYNDGLCSVLTYDGQSWAINNNNKQTIAAQFVKKDSGWAFEK